MDGFEFGGLLMGEEGSVVHSFVLGILIVFFLFIFFDAFFLGIFVDNFFGEFLDSLVGDPLVVPTVEGFVVDVIFVGCFVFFSCGIIIYIMKWKKKK